MKYLNLSSSLLSFFSLGILLPLLPAFTSFATAQCVMIDVGAQTAIHGSPNPSTQVNNVDMNSSGNCQGNAVVTYGTQTAVSNGDVIQIRDVEQNITGDSSGNSGYLPDNGTIKIQVNPQTDVYSPALDSNFWNGLPSANN
jgi:hypothetical protein